MYLDHFSLSCKPFDLLPDPRFLYLGKNHDMALTSLRYGVETGAGFTVITGEIGAGKTTLIRAILNNLTPEFIVGLITNTHKDFGSLLEWVLLSFSLDYRNMSDMERYEKLTDFLVESYAKGKRAVIIVDEAQNLELDSLEKLRVISNLNADHHRILQIILSGQPEFREMLNKPELRQLAQRITVDFHIGPLTIDEVGNYISHRMRVAGCDREVFTKGAIEKIGEYTKGIPRLINILCNNALVFAYADKLETIDREALASVISVTKDIGMLPFGRIS